MVLQNLKQNLVYITKCNDQNYLNLGKIGIERDGGRGWGEASPIPRCPQRKEICVKLCCELHVSTGIECKVFVLYV